MNKYLSQTTLASDMFPVFVQFTQNIKLTSTTKLGLFTVQPVLQHRTWTAHTGEPGVKDRLTHRSSNQACAVCELLCNS